MARYSKLAPNTVKHVGGKPSGKEVVRRRSKLEAALTAGFVQEEGFEVSRESVLAYILILMKTRLHYLHDHGNVYFQGYQPGRGKKMACILYLKL